MKSELDILEKIEALQAHNRNMTDEIEMILKKSSITQGDRSTHALYKQKISDNQKQIDALRWVLRN
ncbi:hypothetical protein GXP69_18740 [Pontibacter sp. BT327]|uniref:Uncharacterized protein n=1 Tax=Pontibacter burrus TaxID=2704466 RepID=A0A6B3M2D4_9BACT|nr:hypothetical protein [Pontibacter burrus]